MSDARGSLGSLELNPSASKNCPPAAKACLVCVLPLTGSSARVSATPCPQCTFINVRATKECEMCRIPLTDQQQHSPASLLPMSDARLVLGSGPAAGSSAIAAFPFASLSESTHYSHGSSSLSEALRVPAHSLPSHSHSHSLSHSQSHSQSQVEHIDTRRKLDGGERDADAAALHKKNADAAALHKKTGNVSAASSPMLHKSLLYPAAWEDEDASYKKQAHYKQLHASEQRNLFAPPPWASVASSQPPRHPVASHRPAEPPRQHPPPGVAYSQQQEPSSVNAFGSVRPHPSAVPGSSLQHLQQRRDPVYVCHECAAQFSSSDSLNVHLNQHEIDEESGDEESESPRACKCHLCARIFRTRTGLTVHLTWHRKQTGQTQKAQLQLKKRARDDQLEMALKRAKTSPGSPSTKDLLGSGRISKCAACASVASGGEELVNGCCARCKSRSIINKGTFNLVMPTDARDVETSLEEAQCKICLTNWAKLMPLDCLHLFICYSCARLPAWTGANGCDVCRKPIKALITAYT